MAKILMGVTFLLLLPGDSGENIISTKNGDIRGVELMVRNRTVMAYLGIPYATPPLGELRFKAPVPMQSWKGVYNTTQNAPGCMQPASGSENVSEDCLYLNVWVPNCNDKSMSTMVWIYGGGFQYGSISDDLYDGRVIAAQGCVIVASINYRLGPFGFLYSGTEDAPGNMGMLDQVLGLRWIKDNINAFGGSSCCITIFGQSAGAISCSTHTVSPLTKGLFRRVIMQSGSAYHACFPRSPSSAKSLYNKFSLVLGCASESAENQNDSEVMKCMRNLSASNIIIAAIGYFNSSAIPSFVPTYGDTYLPVHPMQAINAGKVHEVTTLSGVTTDEGSAFLAAVDPRLLLEDDPRISKNESFSYLESLFLGLKNPSVSSIADYYTANTLDGSSLLLKKTFDSFGDWLFVCPSIFLSERTSTYGMKNYRYVFSQRLTWPPIPNWIGVPHGGEIPYLFGMPLRYDQYTREEEEFSKDIIDTWTTFAKSGVANFRTLEEDWPPFTNESTIAADLNAYNASYVDDYREACQQFWKRFSKIGICVTDR